VNDYAARLTSAIRKQEHANLRPRDAATLIIIDFTKDEPVLLMGRRHERHAFLPGKFVFPGGRVDLCDSRIAVADTLDAKVERKLLSKMKGRPASRRAQALALAAIRETWEETGLLLGKPTAQGFKSSSPAWSDFAKQGMSPAISALSFVFRAITPPRRPRRYDTRFFCISAEHIVHRADPDNDELLDLHWLPFGKALELDLPIITKVVLEELREKLHGGKLPSPEQGVPYYYMRNGVFRREML